MTAVTLELAKANDLDVAWPILKAAKQRLNASGIDLWQGDYPNEDIVKSDINDAKLYLIKFEGQTAGIITLEDRPEDYQDALVGTPWRVAENYLAVHRLAVDEHFTGKGIAKSTVAEVLDFAQKNGQKAVRIDTHKDNEPMKRVIDNLGFTYLGKVPILGYADNLDGVAYEKVVSDTDKQN